MNMKQYLLALFLFIIMGTSYAQLSISFGDNPEKVHNVLKTITNQINSGNEGIHAYTKANYENGRIVEIWHVKKNITNLYGTLSTPFTSKERLIFKENALVEKLVEIPEKSLREVNNAIENSHLFLKIEDKLFSGNYLTEYTVYLNSEKVVTVKGVSTAGRKYSGSIQSKVDDAQKSEETKGSAVREPVIVKDEPVVTSTIKTPAEYVGGQSALAKFINNNLEIPKDAEDFSGRIIVKFVVEKDGTLSDIRVENMRSALSVPASLKDAITQVFLKMPKWKAARDAEGRAVSSYSTLPLNL